MAYETIQRIESLKAFYSGLREGVTMFAHWKDGVQYVGTCGKSLSTAIKELNIKEEKRIGEIRRIFP
jgi:hypothetical protein